MFLTKITQRDRLKITILKITSKIYDVKDS